MKHVSWSLNKEVRVVRISVEAYNALRKLGYRVVFVSSERNRQ
jgi:hypothetical protein